jgi:hypothetical protein
MDADAIAALRAQATNDSGDWIGLPNVGDWFAGRVADPSHQTVTTDFGETEELLVEDVTINDQEQAGTMTFRLSRSVLQRELGSDAEEVPGPGWAVLVTYKGLKRGQSGREYHSYSVRKAAPDLEAVAATAKAKSKPKAKADGGDEIPF